MSNAHAQAGFRPVRGYSMVWYIQLSNKEASVAHLLQVSDKNFTQPQLAVHYDMMVMCVSVYSGCVMSCD